MLLVTSKVHHWRHKKLRSALLILLAVTSRVLLSEAGVSTTRRYTDLGLSSTTVGGNYSTYQQLSRIQCSNLCQNNNSCYIFGWDVASKECLIFTGLDPTTPRVPASETLITYYLISDPEGYEGTLEFIGEKRNPWTLIRESCADLGGDLPSPVSPQFAYMLYTVTQQRDIAIGLEMDSITSDWYDTKGKVFTDFNWDVGEPDGGTQYYSFLREGRFWDINDANRTYYVLCRMP